MEPSISHRDAMAAALELEAEAQRLALSGAESESRRAFQGAAEQYRTSWELASRTSYGRLVGMLKAAILGGGGGPEAAYARQQLAQADEGSPTAAYARALASLVEDDDGQAGRWAQRMGPGSPAFERTAVAIKALAERDHAAYLRALREIVSDFESRSEHLTGVAIADTAMMLDCLASGRGMAAELESPLLPPR